MNSHQIDLARRLYQQADAQRWQVARIAASVTTRREALQLADAIGRGEDTVRNLRNAYVLFAELVKWSVSNGKTSEPIRKLRRRYPYTRWALVFYKWTSYEFPLDEAVEWLDKFEGGNDAMSAEIDNKHGRPEWERRAFGIYSQAQKLKDDFGVPDGLRTAAANYAAEYKRWEGNE